MPRNGPFPGVGSCCVGLKDDAGPRWRARNLKSFLDLRLYEIHHGLMKEFA
jgi:hypothetical protein